jgi:hypothetical protein
MGAPLCAELLKLLCFRGLRALPVLSYASSKKKILSKVR